VVINGFEQRLRFKTTACHDSSVRKDVSLQMNWSAVTTSVIGQWVTGGAGSVVKPAVHCTYANCVLCISSIWCLNKTKNKRNRSLVSGITSIWQEEDVQVWFWWRIKDERGEGIGLGAMRWQTKSNRTGYLLGSQVLRFNRKVRSGSDNNSFPVTVS